jgi:D-inositol-3-phosphate glycosyltransferase
MLETVPQSNEVCCDRKEGNPRSSRVRSIGILLDEHVQYFTDPDISPRVGSVPDFTQGTPRGNVIASKTIVEALLKHGKFDRCHLFTYSSAEKSVSRGLKSASLSESLDVKGVVHAIEDIPVSGFPSSGLDAWFNPLPQCSINGGIEISQSLRGNFSASVYPITTLFHGLGTHRLLYNLFLRFILGDTLACDSIICTSRASRESLHRILDHLEDGFNRAFGTSVRRAGRIDLVPLGIDTSEFRPGNKTVARTRLQFPPDTFVVLYLGKISPLKADLFPFLEVFHRLVNQNPARKLLWVLAGSQDGKYGDLLLRHASEMGMAGQVKLMPYVSGASKTELITAADVLFCPSDTVDETFGLAPVEAMACGVPQLVSDWDGFRDTVSHGSTGFLIPTYWTNCSDDLAHSGTVAGPAFDRLSLSQSVAIDLAKTGEYLQILLDNEELRNRMGVESRERALKIFSFESVVKQYEDLWAHLSDTARRLTPTPRPFSFDETLYNDFFGHYASQTLHDDTKLKLTEIGRCNGPDQDRQFAGLISSKLFKRETLKKLLAELAARTGPKNVPDLGSTVSADYECTIGGLLDSSAVAGHEHPHKLRRHLMWLIKYGLVEPIIMRTPSC